MRRYGLILLGLALMLGAGLRDQADHWIDATRLPQVLTESSVEIRDREGALLRAYPVADGIMRLATQVADVDPAYLGMLVAYEDKRFFSHAGVDPRALVRAFWQSLRNGRVVSGASTLTMQVARLLEDSGTGRWQGKIRQIRVALALERRLFKKQILNLYLSHAPFGGNLEGVRAASHAWFGKEPRRLTPAEASLLVALPQSPSARRPDRHPATARAARGRVLDRMARRSTLPDEQINEAREATLPQEMRAFPRLAPHLGDYLRQRAPEQRQHRVTLQRPVQQAFEKLAADWAQRQGRDLSVALLAADISEGQVVAYVGSPDYGDRVKGGFVDMVRASRSPGSTLKPLVYGVAFDRGLAHPETLIHDGPVQFGAYAPQNFDRLYRGDVSMRAALQMSLNIPVVKLTAALGPAHLLKGVRDSGAEVALATGQPGLAVSLGGLGMSLWDLTQLYAGLARGGQAVALSVSATDHPQGRRFLSAPAAWHVGNILAGIAPPQGAGRAGEIAFKTGTSYGHRDAWALGFDGRHVVGVWVGRADGTPVPGIFGADLAAPLLFEAFARLGVARTPLPPPPSETLFVAHAELPQALRRFGPRVDHQDHTGPEMVFPPDGAILEHVSGQVVLKLRGGVAPFVVLQDGAPVKFRQQRRDIALPDPGPGFVRYSVIDAKGRAARVAIEIR